MPRTPNLSTKPASLRSPRMSKITNAGSTLVRTSTRQTRTGSTLVRAHSRKVAGW